MARIPAPLRRLRDRGSRAVRRIPARSLWAVGLVAFLLTLAATILLVQGLHTRAEQLNVTGRQRMYIQKMAKDALAVAHRPATPESRNGVSEWEQALWDLPAAMTRFQEAQRWLLHGTFRGTPMAPVTDPGVRGQLRRVEAGWQSYRAKLEEVLAAPEVPVALQEAILAQARDLWRAMDEAVRGLERVSRRESRRRRIMALALMGGVSLLLLVGGGAARAHFRAATVRDRLGQILRSVPDPVFYKDDRLVFLGCNGGVERIIGRPAREIVGATDFDLFDPDTARLFREADQQAIRTGRSQRNPEWVQDADGQWIYLDMLKAPLDLGGGRTGVLGIGRDLTEQRRIEENWERLAAIVEASPDLICSSDPHPRARVFYINPAGRSLLGLSEAPSSPELLSFTHIYADWALDRLAKEALPTVEQEGSWRGELALKGDHGQEIPVDVTLLAFRDEEGRLAQFSTIARDIRAQKRAEEALHRAALLEESVANALIDVIPGLFYLFDENGGFHRWNDRLEELTGLSDVEIQRHHPLDLFPEEDRETVEDLFKRGFREGVAEVEASLLTPQGPVPFLFRAESVELEGERYLCGMGVDISDRKALEAELIHQATHDPLTGLLNRRRLGELLETEIQRAERYGTPFSLVLLDIDHFKAINDTHGHDVGDRVLRGMSETVAGRIRATDHLARWGGEELLVLLPETGLEGALGLAEDIRRRVATTSFQGPDRVTVSVGVVEYRDQEPPRELIRRVDDALYAAKAAGRDRVVTAEG